MLIPDKKFALLIDADNVSSKYIKVIIDELTNFGTITYKRIYGDWTKPTTEPWKDVLLEYSITPMQQYAYTTGKNATDSAMIIDAMDILYSGKVDGFCLVSSDSDFTRLAVRLREAGMEVIGMGETKTLRPFVAACNQFKYVDKLRQQADAENGKDEKQDNPAKGSTGAATGKKQNKTAEKKGITPKGTGSEKQALEDEKSSLTPAKEIKRYIRDLLEQDEDGIIQLSALGQLIPKKYPDFDVRNYGCNKMSVLLTEWGFHVESIKDEKNTASPSQIYFIKQK